jgi:predicted nuclease of predicted toxin-antitoxin system
MKLLLDESLPVKLKYRFIEKGYESFTTRDMKWLGTKNGDLLKLMLENDFTTFITIDNNIAFQQNFNEYPIQVIVLVAHDNTYETIMEFFESIIENLSMKFKGVKVVVHPDF